jgi:hypothetical protein
VKIQRTPNGSSSLKRLPSRGSGMIILTMMDSRNCNVILPAIPRRETWVPGAGGIRKLRWKDPRRGKGKRGGLRVIYYCFLSEQETWLLTLYDKDEAADLTKDEREQLRRALEAERIARKARSRK